MNDPKLAALLRAHPAPARPNQLGHFEPAPLPLCPCFDGMCRCQVVEGRTSTGALCKAQLRG